MRGCEWPKRSELELGLPKCPDDDKLAKPCMCGTQICEAGNRCSLRGCEIALLDCPTDDKQLTTTCMCGEQKCPRGRVCTMRGCEWPKRSELELGVDSRDLPKCPDDDKL